MPQDSNLGTITWIPISNGIPPFKHPNTRFTEWVLLLLPSKEIVKSRGVWLAHDTTPSIFAGWEHTDEPYYPTHYAFINYPTDQDKRP